MTENPNRDQRLDGSPKQRVLVIDASRAFSSGLSALLDSQIYEGKSFQSTAEATAALESYVPNCIICDLELAATDNFAFVRNLKKEGPFAQTPILVLSSSEDSAKVLQAVEAGADVLCSKENVRANLLAQMRLITRNNKEVTSDGSNQRLKEVQTKIGTIRHDLGNAMAVLEGKFRTLLRTQPGITQDPAVISMKSALERVGKLHKELNNLIQDHNEVEMSKTTKAG